MSATSQEITETIVEFGSPMLGELDTTDQLEMESALRLVVTIWNAVVLDQGYKTRHHEGEVLKTIEAMPEGFIKLTRKLLKRKKRKYGAVSVLVKHYALKDEDGHFLPYVEGEAV